MPDIKRIQEAIQARLAELEKQLEPLCLEAQALTKVAAGLADNVAQAARPRGAGAPKRPASVRKGPRAGAAGTGAKRGRPPGSGNRALQALADINDRPGITAAELAESMGIGRNYLYRVLPRLERDGKVTKRGRGYHPAGAGEADVSPPGSPTGG